MTSVCDKTIPLLIRTYIKFIISFYYFEKKTHIFVVHNIRTSSSKYFNNTNVHAKVGSMYKMNWMNESTNETYCQSIIVIFM